MSRSGRTHRSALVTALALLLSACAVVMVEAPDAPLVTTVTGRSSSDDATPDPASAPAGEVVVAYPDPVGVWWQEAVEDVAAGDLAALWGLPLQRTDQLGRALPGLALTSSGASTDDGWAVTVELAPGTWSDGAPVTAADVVATAGALREVRPQEWAAFTGADVVDDHTVRLRFDRPYVRWAALLSGAPGVLPAHVLEQQGLAAFAGPPPVTGGPFSIAAHEQGLRTEFVANPGSPLGPPTLARVVVTTVPSHEVALGLLDDGTVDAVLGHVALDPVARRERLAGVVGDAVFGGTRFELAWDPDASTSAQRRTAAGTLTPDAFVEGLLRDAGRLPGGLRPSWTAPSYERAEGGGDVALLVPRTVEGIGLLARLVQADLQSDDLPTSLVRLDPPLHLDPPVAVDATLRLVRVHPDRSLAALLASGGLEPTPGVEADAVAGRGDPAGGRTAPTGAAGDVAALVAADPVVLPLAEVAVAHVWDPERVTGIVPSGWPGVGFWNVAAWRVPVASS